jgi:ABC-type polysaccharide/polyol phosphate export permease
MFNSISRVFAFRHVLWNMAIKQLKVKYTGAKLGIWWALLNPLLIMLAISFVFTLAFKVKINNFPFFVLIGIFPWLFFSSALTEASVSILNQQGILRQFNNLPKELIPLSSVLSNFLNFLIGWLIIYPLFIFFNHKIVYLLPFLVAVILMQFLFISGLGMMLSALNVFIRDINQLLGILLMFWFWVTPIFYSLDMFPEGFRWVYSLNPMAYYVLYYREVVFMGNLPGMQLIIGTFSWAFVSLILGLWTFSRLESRLLKLI